MLWSGPRLLWGAMGLCVMVCLAGWSNLLLAEEPIAPPRPQPVSVEPGPPLPDLESLIAEKPKAEVTVGDPPPPLPPPTPDQPAPQPPLPGEKTPRAKDEPPPPPPLDDTPPKETNPNRASGNTPTGVKATGPTPEQPTKLGGKVKAEQLKLEGLKAKELEPTRFSASEPFYGRYGRFRNAQADQPLLKGFQALGVEFHPSGSIRYEYNEDPLGLNNTPSGKSQDDIIGHYRAGVDTTYRANSMIQLSANYHFTWNDYMDDIARDYLEHSASVRIDFKNAGVRNLNFALYNNYGQTGNTGVYNQLETNVLPDDIFESYGVRESFLAFSRVQNDVSGLQMDFKKGKWQAGAVYEFSFTDYFKAQNQNSDTFTHQARGEVSYDLHRYFKPFFKYSYDHVFPVHIEGLGSEGHIWEIGGNSQITQHLSGSLTFSPRVIEDLVSHQWSIDETVNAKLAYQVTRQVGLGVSGTSGLQTNEAGADNRFWGYGLDASFRITNKLNSGLYASFRNSYSNPGARSQTNIYGLSFNYQLHRNLDLSIQYSRRDEWTHSAGKTFSNDFNTGNIQFSARF